MKDKMANEKVIVKTMIELYCRKKEGNKDLCPGCLALLQYAEQRLDHCRFGVKKSSCKRCPIHCYRPEMREKIRQVMRFSGPRILFYHPLAAIKHLFGK